jgi:hypothetical protein
MILARNFWWIMRRYALSLSLLMVLSGAARAGEPACTIEQATDQLQLDAIQFEGRSAQASQPLLTELSQINGKATDSQKPLGDQLSSKDTARFSEITTQLQLMRLSAYVESGRGRDAAVVQQMFTAAWKSYLDPNYVPDQNDFPGLVVFLLRLLPPGSNSSPWRQPTGTACTVDFAIANQEQEGFHRINALKPTIDRNKAVILQLRDRYGVGADGKLDTSKMPPEDARKLQIVQTEMAPGYKEASLSKDLEHIRAWWEIADMIYRTRKDDVATYASIEHIGDTLQAQSSGMNPEQLALIGLWQKIDEKVRSHEQREMEEMGDALRSLK